MQGKDIRFEFIKIEQAIHLITDISATQDISGYLLLTEEVCDKEKLCDLVFLLHRKFNRHYEDYSEEYVKWLSFLVPFIEYLAKINFKYQNILNFSIKDLKDKIAETFANFKEFLPESDFIDRDVTSIPGLLSLFDEIKNAFLHSKLPRDIKFYGKFGEFSLIINLLNFCMTQNQTFLRLCTLIPLYFDAITKINSSSQEADKVLESIKTAKMKYTLDEKLLKQLVDDLKTPDILKKQEKIFKLQIIESLLLSIQSSKTELRKFFLESTWMVNNSKELKTLYIQKPFISIKKEPNRPPGLSSSQEPRNVFINPIIPQLPSFDLFGNSKESNKLDRQGAFSSNNNASNSLYFKPRPIFESASNYLIFLDKKLFDLSLNQNSLLSDILLIAENNKETFGNLEAPFYGSFFNNYESLVYALFRLMRCIFLSDFLKFGEMSTFLDIVERTLENFLLTNQISRLLTRDNFYFFSSQLAIHGRTKFSDKILKNWNLSSISLREILKSQENIHLEDISLNLRYSYCTFKEKNDIITISSYDNLLDIYKEFMSKITEKNQDPVWIEKLKHIGILLTGIISHNINHVLNSIRDQFVEVIMPFMTQKAQLDSWELLIFQKYFWKLLSFLNESDIKCPQKKTKDIFSSQMISDFLILCENQIAQSPIKTLSLSEMQIPKNAKFKEKIYSVIYSSLQRIRNNLDSLWNLPHKDTEENKKIQINYRRLIYFTLPWIAYFASLCNTDEEDIEKLEKIIDSVIYLNFHPSWVSTIENYEKEILEQFYINIIKLFKQTRKYALQNVLTHFYETLKEIKLEQLSDPASKKDFLELIENIKFPKKIPDLKNKLTLTFKEYALVYSTLTRLSKLRSLFDVGEDSKYTQKQNQIDLNLIKNALNKFTGLVFYLASCSDLSQNEDSKVYKDQNLFTGSLIEGLETLLNLIYQIQQNDMLTFYLRELLNKFDSKGKPNNQISYFRNIFIRTILSLGDSTRNWVLNVVFSQQNATKFFLRWVLDAFGLKIKSFTGDQHYTEANQIEYETALKFIDRIFSCISSEQNLKSIKEIADRYRNDDNSKDKSLVKLLQTIAAELEEFPILELINLRNVELSDQFVPILQVLEKIYVYAKNDLLQDTSKIQEKTTKNEKQIYPIKNENLQEEKSFEELDNIEAINCQLDQDFFSKANLFWFVYNFKNLDENASKIVEIKALTTFSKFLFDFSYLRIKELKPDLLKELVSVSDPCITKDGTFAGVKLVQNETLNHVLTIQHYLQYITVIISKMKDPPQFEESFISYLCHCSTLLLKKATEETFFTSVKDKMKYFFEMPSLLKELMKDLAQLFVVHFSNKNHVSGSLYIFDWIENVFKFQTTIIKELEFDILSSEQSTLSNLFILTETLISFNPRLSINYLLGKTSIINYFMKVDKEMQGISLSLNYFAFICDNLLKYLLNDDIFIETKLKQIWIEKANSKNSVNLMDFAKDSFILEKEYINMDQLNTILLEKFKLIDNPNDSSSKNSNAYEKLNLSLGTLQNFNSLMFIIDLSQEPKTPQESLDRALRSIPTEVQKLLDILKKSLIENYLFNLSCFSEMEDKQNIEQTKLRQTSNILIVIFMLVEKYRVLIADLAFRKTDYSQIIEEYSSKIPFLNGLGLKNFESMTFMECLFETQYLAFSQNDFVNVVQMFMLNTGITFLCLDDPDSVVDISRIMTIKLILCFVCQIKNQLFFSKDISNENAYRLCVTIFSAHYIWNLLDKNSLKGELGEYTHLSFLDLMKHILKLLKLIPQDIKLDVNVLIVEILKESYKIQLSSASLASEAAEKLKQEDYESFLVDNNLEIQNKYENYIQKIRTISNPEIRLNQEENTNFKLSYQTKNKETTIDKKVFGPIFTLNLPLKHECSICKNLSKSLIKTVISPNNQNFFRNLVEYFDKMTTVLPSNFHFNWLTQLKVSTSKNRAQNHQERYYIFVKLLKLNDRFYDFVYRKLIINNSQPSQEGDERIHTISKKSSGQSMNAVEETKTDRSKLDEFKFRYQQLYIIDDETVESLISFFYLFYGKLRILFQDIVIQMLQELCKLATFEIKILDFCFFFLYCPDHLETLSQKNNNFSYSHLKIQWNPYEVVASNILTFLRKLTEHREEIIYQPAFLLKTYGLKSLRDLKKKTKYDEKTSKLVSVCDLIIGLLDIFEIKGKTDLYEGCSSLLSNILSTPKDFDIVQPHEVEHYKREKNILTLYSCQRILATRSFDEFLINYPIIVLSCQLADIQDYIQELHPKLEKVNSCLKYKALNKPETLKPQDIQKLLQMQQTFFSLNKNISKISSQMLDRVLTKDMKKNKTFAKILNTLKEQLFHENNENFFIHLFELANYLSFPGFSQSNEANSLMDAIFGICKSFYVLVNIQKDASQLPLIQKTLVSDVNSMIPILSIVVSSELSSDESLGRIPLLTSSYSSMRKSKEPDFDSLFIDMSRSHSNLLANIFLTYNSHKSAMKDIGFILAKFPWLIDFSTKMQALADSIQKDLQYTREIKIDRNNIIGSTLKEFSNLPPRMIRGKVQVNFKGEEATDGGGPKQEWMTLIIKELFDPIKGLFEISKNGNSLQLVPKSKPVSSHLKCIEFAGVMLGKVIQEGAVVDVNFTKPILKHILGRQITIKDLEDIEPDLAKNLRWILENKIDSLDLGLTFTYEFDAFGHRITRELMPNGPEIDVTDDNKREYVKRFCEMKVTDEIKEELETFIKGIYLILPAGCLSPFTPSELQLLIGGIQTIDPKELARHTKYEGYDCNSDVIKWFWEILGQFSQKELASLIMFATGTVRVCYEVLKQKPFRIARIGYEKDFLPIAHTCYHQIQIPEYISKEELKQKLLIAINEGQGSFAFA